MSVFQERCDAVAERLRACKVVPVVAVPDVASGLKLCGILRDAGLSAVEVTFRTAAGAELIRAAAREFPDMLLGAGTVTSPAQAQASLEAGARFAVAPGCNPRVVEAAIGMGLPFFPGIATPSEIEKALELGCRMLKFFPAEALGGVAMLKALIAPYKHLGVRFMPTGGVSLSNLRDYVSIPEVVAVGGTWLAKQEDLAAGAWETIAATARKTRAALDSGPAS